MSYTPPPPRFLGQITQALFSFILSIRPRHASQVTPMFTWFLYKIKTNKLNTGVPNKIEGLYPCSLTPWTGNSETWISKDKTKTIQPRTCLLNSQSKNNRRSPKYYIYDLAKLIINLAQTIVNINITDTERFEICSQTLQKNPKSILFVEDVQLYEAHSVSLEIWCVWAVAY